MNKRKLDFDLEDIVLKVAGMLVLTITAVAFFAPKDGQLRNRPLLYAFLLFFIGRWLLKSLLNLRLLCKVKKLFAAHGAKDIKLHINPFGAWLRGDYRLYGTYNNTSYSIVILLRKNPWITYNFASNEQIEYYKSTRAVSRRNKVTGEAAKGAVYTRCVGKRKVKWLYKNAEISSVKLIVFNKMPLNVTTYASPGAIDVGMPVCEDTFIFDVRALENHFI